MIVFYSACKCLDRTYNLAIFAAQLNIGCVAQLNRAPRLRVGEVLGNELQNNWLRSSTE